MSHVRFQNPWCVGTQQDLFDLPDMGETKSECRLYIQDMLSSLTSSSVTWIGGTPWSTALGIEACFPSPDLRGNPSVIISSLSKHRAH